MITWAHLSYFLTWKLTYKLWSVEKPTLSASSSYCPLSFSLTHSLAFERKSLSLNLGLSSLVRLAVQQAQGPVLFPGTYFQEWGWDYRYVPWHLCGCQGSELGCSCCTEPPLLPLGFYCYDKMPWPKQLWEERVYFSLQVTVNHKWKLRQEPGSRNWICGRMLPTGFFPSLFSVTFPI